MKNTSRFPEAACATADDAAGSAVSAFYHTSQGDELSKEAWKKILGYGVSLIKQNEAKI